MGETRELRTNRIRKADVRDQTFAEERGDASPRAIKQLIGDDELERLMFLLQRSDSGQGKNPRNSEFFHAIDVGAEIEFGWGNLVAAPVTRQKRDLVTRQVPNHVVVRRRAPGRVECQFLFHREPGHGVQAAAANDADVCLMLHLLMS